MNRYRQNYFGVNINFPPEDERNYDGPFKLPHFTLPENIQKQLRHINRNLEDLARTPRINMVTFGYAALLTCRGEIPVDQDEFIKALNIYTLIINNFARLYKLYEQFPKDDKIEAVCHAHSPFKRTITRELNDAIATIQAAINATTARERLCLEVRKDIFEDARDAFLNNKTYMDDDDDDDDDDSSNDSNVSLSLLDFPW